VYTDRERQRERESIYTEKEREQRYDSATENATAATELQQSCNSSLETQCD